MDTTVPDLDVQIPEITQVSFVVEDLEDGMDRFGGMFGIGPWDVYRFEPPELTQTTYRGEPHDYSMVLALAFVGETMVELIEPLEGPSIYTDHLEEHGEGLHHIACFAFEDTRAVVDRLEGAGIPVIQSGVYGEMPFWYFDMRERLNGLVFETATNLQGTPRPDRTYPE